MAKPIIFLTAPKMLKITALLGFLVPHISASIHHNTGPQGINKPALYMSG